MERGEAKALGQPAGAVQLLLVGADGRILLQRRRHDRENGDLWDKSVGGHVLAGESFDHALVREANEELFGQANADRVALVDDLSATATDLRPVRARHIRTELGLRDIRYAAPPLREVINVTYHAAMYLGRTTLALEDFCAQEEELAELGWFEPAEIDRMLVSGRLAPNMGFLWFALGGLATAPLKLFRGSP
jgi:8-oxo-dGTP pyrophosphatase MutT (NUDIX family)